MSWNIVVEDGSGDYYVIPEDKQADFQKYCEEDCWTDDPPPFPAYANYVGGYAECVRFKEWEKKC